MPALDWTWLEAINLLQVAVFIVALWVIFRLLIRFWPWLKKLIALLDALGQLPEFIDRTDKSIHCIQKETTHNGGSSLKDAQVRTENAVARIEIGVKGLYERVDASDRADAQLREEIEHTIHPTHTKKLNTKDEK